MSNAIEMFAVASGYGETVVLSNVSFALAKGATLALLGRNGVGKSTLLGTIMGLTTLHAGRIALGGHDIASMPIYERARSGLGYVPQEREIFPSLTVLENLSVAGRSGRWTVEAIFEMFPGLADRRMNYGNQLSGGEQQMLAVGRALMGNPHVLLLDEPLEGLAPVIVDHLMRAFEALSADHGLTIIFVEQHTRLALNFAADTLVLDRGEIIFSGKSAVLLKNSERLDELVGVRR